MKTKNKQNESKWKEIKGSAPNVILAIIGGFGINFLFKLTKVEVTAWFLTITILALLILFEVYDKK